MVKKNELLVVLYFQFLSMLKFRTNPYDYDDLCYIFLCGFSASIVIKQQ